MCNTTDKAHYAVFFTRGPSKRGKLTKNPFLPGRGEFGVMIIIIKKRKLIK